MAHQPCPGPAILPADQGGVGDIDVPLTKLLEFPQVILRAVHPLVASGDAVFIHRQVSLPRNLDQSCFDDLVW